MSEWQETKLKDLCEKVTVGHVGPMADAYQNNGIPFLRPLNIKSFNLDLGDVKFISNEFHTKLRKSALHPGDVVVVRGRLSWDGSGDSEIAARLKLFRFGNRSSRQGSESAFHHSDIQFCFRPDTCV